MKVNIDGTIESLDPSALGTDFSYVPGFYNEFTSVPGHDESSRRFVVPISFVQRMIAAKRVIGQTEMPGHFAEGKFAPGPFSNALAKIRDARSPQITAR